METQPTFFDVTLTILEMGTLQDRVTVTVKAANEREAIEKARTQYRHSKVKVESVRPER
jgi:hypothetical protein